MGGGSFQKNKKTTWIVFQDVGVVVFYPDLRRESGIGIAGAIIFSEPCLCSFYYILGAGGGVLW